MMRSVKLTIALLVIGLTMTQANDWLNTRPLQRRSDDMLFQNELDISQIDLFTIPKDILLLHPTVTSVSLSYNKIKSIRRDDFPWMNETYIIKLDGNYIEYIADDAFANIPNLLEIDLSNNLLKGIPRSRQRSELTTMNLQHNQIDSIQAEDLANYPYLEHFDVQDNKIRVLKDNTFRGNRWLEKLVLNQNPLQVIEANALVGPKSLKTLYLRNTLISSIPRLGISEVTKLDIRQTPRLFTIPDPVGFEKLKTITVTYSMHCCAFKEERTRRKLNNTRRCDPNELKGQEPRVGKIKREDADHNKTVGDPFDDIFKSFVTNEVTANESPCTRENLEMAKKKIVTDVDINCKPEPDAFNPCQDVMGTHVLRAFSWIVSIFAIIGNIFQLAILFHNRQELTVYKLLMYNLGFANLMMGVYLLVLCCVDAYTYGRYYNFVRSWQYNGGCQVFGFIAVFATQLSLCSLVLITAERFLLIIFALQVQYQMKLRHAKIAVLLSWIYSILLATFPATSAVSNYTRVAICLPFEVTSRADAGYLVWMLLAYVLAFFFIVYCYITMYCSISDSRHLNASSNIDFQVAKRMSMIIFSNFVCWLPISVAGIMALYSGYTFNVKVAKFLLVFVFPLNACTNPFLYAIFTKVFRGDILHLLASCGLCRNAEQEYQRRRGPQNGSFQRAKKPRSETKVSFRSHYEYNDKSKGSNRPRDVEGESCVQKGNRANIEDPPKVAYACVNVKKSDLDPGNDVGEHGLIKKTPACVRLIVDESNERNRTESNATCSTDRSLLSAVELDEDLRGISSSANRSRCARSTSDEGDALLR